LVRNATVSPGFTGPAVPPPPAEVITDWVRKGGGFFGFFGVVFSCVVATVDFVGCELPPQPARTSRQTSAMYREPGPDIGRRNIRGKAKQSLNDLQEGRA
jgi:hypothetical protein